MRREVPVLGFLVNPFAGIGGRLALKGSDDERAVALALSSGAVPVSAPRAGRALAALRRALPELAVLAAPGEMGAELASAAGFATGELPLSLGQPTTRADTLAAARELARRRVDLLLFAGGDGTARDIAEAVGRSLPALGIPAGVKMRSAVFGTTPEAAGEAAGRYLLNPEAFPLRDAEVVDAADAAGGLASTLHGLLCIPAVPGRLQAAKSAAPRSDEAALEALARDIAAAMSPGHLYLVGPGTTAARVLTSLGLEATTLGVDAVRDGALVGSDLDEQALLGLLADASPVTLILGVIGSQGFLLGRGNQQLSAAVMRRIGAENVVILAGADKVLALDPPLLRVDLGDGENDPVLDGYRRVEMGPQLSTVMRVAR